MADSFNIDHAALDRLIVELERIPDDIGPGITKATAVSANKVKKHWRDTLDSSAVPASGSTINYEVSGSNEGTEAIIEASRGTKRLRGFVHAREYGSPTVAPASDARVAAQATKADFVRGLRAAGERAIRRAVDR